MDICQSCARKIKNLREFNNFTQGYVADELNMSQNAYSLLEKGTTKLTIDRLVALANLYDTTPSALLDERDELYFTSGRLNKVESITTHSNFPPHLSELEKLMYEQTIMRLETNIEKLYDLITQLASKIAEPPKNQIEPSAAKFAIEK